jgi:kynurenine formamidase
MGKTKVIDLSVTLVNNPPGSFIQSAITYHTHEEGAKVRGKMFNLPEDFFPEKRFAAKEYCHLENLANLDKIHRPCGFKVAVFPVKIHRGSAGWVRAVAIV